MKTIKKHLIYFLLICAITTTSQAAAAPALINYQGTLTDAQGQAVEIDSKKLTFHIYDAAANGTLIWGPQVFDPVPVFNGVFNVILGTTDTIGRSITDAFATDTRFLAVTVDEIGQSGGTEIVPRQQILSAPFAVQAEHAASADTAAVADTVEGENLYVNPVTENVGIGTITPNKKLEVVGSASISGILNVISGIQYSDGTVQTSAKLSPPDFESDWFLMSSQQGADSYKEIQHNLGVYPSRVKVLLKAIDGSNEGFIFEGVGSQGQDDDTASTSYGTSYGGVIFAYNDSTVRIWAPDKNNSGNYGKIICVGDGWGGEINAQYSDTAEVNVLVWK